MRRYAGDAGVTLALQNHKPLIKDHNDILRMHKRGGLAALEALPGRAARCPTAATRAFAQEPQAVGSLQVLTHFGGEFERRPDGSVRGFERNDGVVGEETNRYYRDFVRSMNEIGYDGYIGYELCHQLPVENGQTVGIKYADHNAQIAAEFMRNLIEAESGSSQKVSAQRGPE